MSSKTKKASNSPANLDPTHGNESETSVVTYNLFSTPEQVAVLKAKAKVISRPQVVDLKTMPFGAVIVATLLEIIPSYKKSIKQPLILAKLENGREVAIPSHASLLNVVAEENNSTLGYKLKYAGKVHIIQKTGTGKSKNFKDEITGEPRQFVVYDVAIVE